MIIDKIYMIREVLDLICDAFGVAQNPFHRSVLTEKVMLHWTDNISFPSFLAFPISSFNQQISSSNIYSPVTL